MHSFAGLDRNDKDDFAMMFPNSEREIERENPTDFCPLFVWILFVPSTNVSVCPFNGLAIVIYDAHKLYDLTPGPAPISSSTPNSEASYVALRYAFVTAGHGCPTAAAAAAAFFVQFVNALHLSTCIVYA